MTYCESGSNLPSVSVCKFIIPPLDTAGDTKPVVAAVSNTDVCQAPIDIIINSGTILLGVIYWRDVD